MTIDRRTVLALVAATAATPARAAFPDRPIRIVVPFAPAGGTDIAARYVAEKMAERLGQPVVVENKPGANGAIAGELVKNAAPDGYTLLVATAAAFAAAPALGAKLPYDVATDFTPVAMLGLFPLVVYAAPNLPVRTLTDFLDLARKEPGKLNYASAGVGSTNHLVFEMIAQKAGIKLNHVPYKGSALAATDVMSGQVQVMVDSLAASLSNIKAGKVTPLAITNGARQPQAPDIPTLQESGLDLAYPGWASIVAPASTPTAVVQTLNAAINAVLSSYEGRARFHQLTIEPASFTPHETATFMAKDRAMLTALIKSAGIKLEE
ncbi:MAG: tripartite tricarboxylate transporter substrate binding protein [Proteobacteria bacterium]|nr:tripartite tricarboxylate transporter substrate binding protein [Pseudomonadota bacterium]